MNRKLSEIIHPELNGASGSTSVFGVKESDPMISSIASDSRLVTAGGLFFALDGVKHKGAEFIPEALAKGAAAIVTSTQSNAEVLRNIMQVAEPRKLLASAAAQFYPRQPKTIVAVTGTNGKTSVANFCQQLWEGLGFKAASIGTLGVKRQSSDAPNPGLTTPDTISLHRILQELAEEGFERVAIEASSHGLDQYRLDGIKIKSAGFTNLTQDHLDYHKDMQDYFKAKSRLFSDLLLPDGTAVINADDQYCKEIINICDLRNIKTIVYGKSVTNSNQGIEIKDITMGMGGLKIKLRHQSNYYELNPPLLPNFSSIICYVQSIYYCQLVLK